MKNDKQTSSRIAALAARILANPNSSKSNKALAGSALAQAGEVRRPKKQRQVRV